LAVSDAALLLAARGVDPFTLKDAPARARGAAVCAACATRMTPVRLDGFIVDLCRGCGALFLDEGELPDRAHDVG
jgi:hypothetical protein